MKHIKLFESFDPTRVDAINEAATTSLSTYITKYINERVDKVIEEQFKKITPKQSNLIKSVFDVDDKKDEIKTKLKQRLGPFLTSEIAKCYKDANYYINTKGYVDIISKVITEIFDDMWDVTKYTIKKISNKEYNKNKAKFLNNVDDIRSIACDELNELLEYLLDNIAGNADGELLASEGPTPPLEKPAAKRKDYWFIKQSPNTDEPYDSLIKEFNRLYKLYTDITVPLRKDLPPVK